MNDASAAKWNKELKLLYLNVIKKLINKYRLNIKTI